MTKKSIYKQEVKGRIIKKKNIITFTGLVCRNSRCMLRGDITIKQHEKFTECWITFGDSFQGLYSSEKDLYRTLSAWKMQQEHIEHICSFVKWKEAQNERNNTKSTKKT